MSDKQDHELQWQAEFELDGTLLVYDNIKKGTVYNDERRRRAAFRWVASETSKRFTREFRRLQVAMWTLIAGVAAIIVSTVGLILILLYH